MFYFLTMSNFNLFLLLTLSVLRYFETPVTFIFLNSEKLFTETAIEHKAAIRSLEIKLARQERLIKMLLSTRGPGRPVADTDDGYDHGTDSVESNPGGNGDTKAGNGKKIVFIWHSCAPSA